MESLRSSGEDNIKTETDSFDELMDTSEAPLDSYFEEGEIQSSEDEEQHEKEKAHRTNISRLFSRSALVPEKNSIEESDLHDNDDENIKKLNRAKRFALVTKAEENLTENQNIELINLYKDLGIDKENERHYRFNAIHMRGVEDMNTNDVLDYFEIYSPLNIEWVNDVSCNIVWSDDISAARALLGLSKRIKNLNQVHTNNEFYKKNMIKATNDDNDEGVDVRDIKIPIPPGYWRIGTPDEKCQFPLLRYATKSDKKQKLMEKMGDYPGLLSQSMKKEINQSRNTNMLAKNSDNNVVSTVKKCNPWSDLAFEWGKADKVERVHYPASGLDSKRSLSSIPVDVPDLRLALKNRKEKRKRYIIENDSDDFDEYEETETRNKVPRMTMYADEEEKKLEKLNRNLGTIRKPVEDLRTKINRKKNQEKYNLRIERQQRLDVISNESGNSDDDYELESSSTWALENYQDLRESLRQNKRYNHGKRDMQRYESEDDESEMNDAGSDWYLQNTGQRSPLQIEIENDEYYERKSKR